MRPNAKEESGRVTSGDVLQSHSSSEANSSSQEEAAKLASSKAKLEIEKLSEDLRQLRKSDFVKPMFWVSGVTPIAALLALIAQIAWSSAKHDRAEGELAKSRADVSFAQAELSKSEAQTTRDALAWEQRKAELENQLSRVERARSSATESLASIRSRIALVLQRIELRPITPYVIKNETNASIDAEIDTNREDYPIRIEPHQEELFVAAQVGDWPTFHIWPVGLNGERDATRAIAPSSCDDQRRVSGLGREKPISENAT
jgi:hypothetical protein